NMLVLPPLRDRQAANYLDGVTRRMGEVLENMGEEISSSWDTECAEEWVKEIEAVDAELDTAWSTVRFARESRKVNPRHRILLRRRHVPVPVESPDWEELVQEARDRLAHLRTIVDIIHGDTYEEGTWDTRFRKQWSEIARDTGRAISDPDIDIDSAQLQDRLDTLAHQMSDDEELPRKLWPIYGSLITTLRYIVSLVDEVRIARHEEILK
ncbi:MAG: hypothetical protein GX983_03875, partial [Corynebacterium sp.]|nr:hypothetical protein [Corynebacterium sp.]